MTGTDPKTTTGAQVTMSETILRKNNRNRGARSKSESGQVNVDISGELLAIGSVKP